MREWCYWLPGGPSRRQEIRERGLDMADAGDRLDR